MRLVKTGLQHIYHSGGAGSGTYPSWCEKVLKTSALLEPYGITHDPDKLAAGEYYNIFPTMELILTPDQYVELVIKGVELAPPTEVLNPSLNGSLPFIKAVEKLEKIIDGVETKDDVYNNRCEVHMPGQALSTYNETLLLEDACTDALQEELRKGWSIIAACPQPDQRRPDYILGRWNPDLS
jgi:hypothetical protein